MQYICRCEGVRQLLCTRLPLLWLGGTFPPLTCFLLMKGEHSCSVNIFSFKFNFDIVEHIE